jgi:D-alanine-D-alanine ligase
MKIAFTYNLRLADVRESEKDAEFDSADTVSAIATALEAGGHEVVKVEVSGPASSLLERLEAIDPDLIFNTAEGERGRMREAFYPGLFEELGIPFTGSDAYTNAITLDGKLAIGLAIGGGAVALGGVVFAILDHPRRVLPHVEVVPTKDGMAARIGWGF